MTQVLAIGADNNAASKFLESYIQSGNLTFLIGSGASAPAIPIAGNIENEINTLITQGKEVQADLRCLEFINQINDVHTKIIAKSDAAVQKVADGYREFISSVDSILFARKNILLPRQANIFSTNYDLFIEHAASIVPGIILNDGFNRTSSLPSDFVYAPELFFDRTFRSGGSYGHLTEIPTINLIKIHGSLSWRKRAHTVAFDSIPIKPLTSTDKNKPTKVKEYLESHFLILPNIRKFHSTLMDRVYYDLLRLFSKVMDQQNVALISFGFSFEDEHILDITKRALRNPTAQLIIFSYDSTCVSNYQAKFAQQRNVTVISPETGVIDIVRLNQILSSVVSGQSDAAV